MFKIWCKNKVTANIVQNVFHMFINLIMYNCLWLGLIRQVFVKFGLVKLIQSDKNENRLWADLTIFSYFFQALLIAI